VCFTECAEQSIKERAVEKSDYDMFGNIYGVDLRAREARYLESCRRPYLRRADRSHHQNVNSIQNDSINGENQSVSVSVVKSAYDAAFKYLCLHVDSATLQNGKVERMSMLM
jgi:hypothetical protein